MILHVCIVTMVFYSTLYTSFSSNTDLVLQSSNFKTDTGLWNAATGIMQGSKRIQEDVIAFETENEYSSPCWLQYVMAMVVLGKNVFKLNCFHY